jgi:hypothetical protein
MANLFTFFIFVLRKQMMKNKKFTFAGHILSRTQRIVILVLLLVLIKLPLLVLHNEDKPTAIVDPGIAVGM